MEAQQRTNEWKEQRLYKFTSSQVWKLTVEPKTIKAKEAGELSETAKTYILEKIAQEIGGFIPEFTSKEVEWGNEQEENARMWYQIRTGFQVGEVGFCQHTEFYGGSPDSCVVDNTIEHVSGVVNGALEIKCPFNSINHLKHCLISSEEYFKAEHRDYYWQCVSHMITLNVDWCDFVSFDPRIDHEIGMFVFRVHRSDEDCQLLLNKIEAANAYKQTLKIKLGLL
jgi:hypothetical protein